MKAIALVGLVAIPSVGLVMAAKTHTAAHEDQESRISRGKYLVEFGGCADCHTPIKMGPKGPEPDKSRYLSGHPENANFPPPPKLAPGPWFASVGSFTAWAGPWGISYAANLTPDRNTGLGFWTEEMFIKAMRTGKHCGDGREILPPMPWQNVAALGEEDIKAVFAYLQSIPPIRNRVPEPEPIGGRVSYD